MFTRKSAMTIALTAFILFAMLVPMASAAPEWVHGIRVLDPKVFYVDPTVPGGDPTKPDKDGNEDIKVNYELFVVGQQVHDAVVTFWLQDSNNVITEPWDVVIIPPAQLQKADDWNSFSQWLDIPTTVNDGWYDLYVCASDLVAFDPAPEPFCTVVENAILVDRVAPTVNLVAPVAGAWLTGKQVLLVCRAEDGVFDLRAGDTWGIKPDSVVFQYRAEPTSDWVTLNVEVHKSNVPNEWYAYWDSTTVPDDDGFLFDSFLRCGAEDLVKHFTWSAQSLIHVENAFSIQLEAGWNLISTPLMLYDDNVMSALLHLKARDAVANIETPSWNAIYTVTNKNAGEPDEYDWSWKKSPEAWPYAPDVTAVPGDLNVLQHGHGYWIHMKTADTLTFHGTWSSTGPIAPPEYQVFEGWNLIGYTHWGQPTAPFFPTQTVANYLGSQVIGGVESLWRYDAALRMYISVPDGAPMIRGAGYWLALSDGGTINP